MHDKICGFKCLWYLDIFYILIKMAYSCTLEKWNDASYCLLCLLLHGIYTLACVSLWGVILWKLRWLINMSLYWLLGVWFIAYLFCFPIFRKPCSGPKLKEMTGSGIFSTESQDNAAEYGSPGSRPCQVLFQNERKIGYTLFSLVCRTFGFQNDLILMLAQNARLIFFFFSRL